MSAILITFKAAPQVDPKVAKEVILFVYRVRLFNQWLLSP